MHRDYRSNYVLPEFIKWYIWPRARESEEATLELIPFHEWPRVRNPPQRRVDRSLHDPDTTTNRE